LRVAVESLIFASGSAAGAALAWFVDRGEPSRSAVLALNAIACGLFGALAAAGMGRNVPAIAAGFGFFGTAAPLTLCLTRSGAGISKAIRHLAATLVLALVSGISCATIGFVSVHGVRQISRKENKDIPVGCPLTVPLDRAHIPAAGPFRRL
jgi:hypothetical protein